MQQFMIFVQKGTGFMQVITSAHISNLCVGISSFIISLHFPSFVIISLISVTGIVPFVLVGDISIIIRREERQQRWMINS